MFSRLVIASAALSVSACEVADRASANPFTLTATQGRLVPENVVLGLRNDSDEHLCVPLAETRLGNGNIRVLPRSDSERFENRPPPRILGGLDVSEGLAVVPPHKSEDFFIYIGDLKGRDPPAMELRGTIRGVGCRALFAASTPQLTARTFRVKLLPASELR